MKKIALLLFVAILLTACQPAATPQPTTVPPTEPPAPTPTSAPVEAIANSTSDLVGIWIFSQSSVKIKFNADGTYRSFSGSETIDEGDYSFDAGKVTWVTAHLYCGDQPPATYEAYVTKLNGKSIVLRMKVVGSDPCDGRAGVLAGTAKFQNPWP